MNISENQWMIICCISATVMIIFDFFMIVSLILKEWRLFAICIVVVVLTFLFSKYCVDKSVDIHFKEQIIKNNTNKCPY